MFKLDAGMAGDQSLDAGLVNLGVPGSYGFSIILLTCIVKAVTFPLTRKQACPPSPPLACTHICLCTFLHMQCATESLPAHVYVLTRVLMGGVYVRL